MPNMSLRGPIPILIVAWLALVVFGTPAVADPRPPAIPAEIAISTSPVTVEPGESVTVRLDLAPIKGVKINRYPKVKLRVPAEAGLVGESEAAVGNDKPPPADKMKSNYFDEFDGLELTLDVDPQARAGLHRLQGKLTYFYCVPASGFCAPHRTPVEIALTVD
jgi:hypothetical protein